jgi:RNA polymerase sigma-70 factor (sigma-E family)
MTHRIAGRLPGWGTATGPARGQGRQQAMAIREPGGEAARQTDVTETLVAEPVISAIAAEQDSENAVCALYLAHYQSLVRLAALLVRDAATAEEVVQDAFVAMHGGWRRLRDTEKALSYLRQSVVNRSRSVLRHRAVVDKYAQKPPPDAPSAEQGAITLLERSAVVAALRGLPARQREALVLRYYADLSEADIARAMGISKGAVKSHTARGMSALRVVLERES